MEEKITVTKKRKKKNENADINAGYTVRFIYARNFLLTMLVVWTMIIITVRSLLNSFNSFITAGLQKIKITDNF